MRVRPPFLLPIVPLLGLVLSAQATPGLVRVVSLVAHDTSGWLSYRDDHPLSVV